MQDRGGSSTAWRPTSLRMPPRSWFFLLLGGSWGRCWVIEFDLGVSVPSGGGGGRTEGCRVSVYNRMCRSADGTTCSLEACPEVLLDSGLSARYQGSTAVDTSCTEELHRDGGDAGHLIRHVSGHLAPANDSETVLPTCPENGDPGDDAAEAEARVQRTALLLVNDGCLVRHHKPVIVRPMPSREVPEPQRRGPAARSRRSCAVTCPSRWSCGGVG